MSRLRARFVVRLGFGRFHAAVKVASDAQQSATRTMGYVALGILKAAIFAAIGRGFVQAFGLDSKVARMINSARADTPNWLAWIMAGSFSLLCLTAWEIFHVDDHLRNAVTWPWEKVAIEGKIFQSGVTVGDVVGGRRSPTDVTVFEFAEITHAQGLNRSEPIEYLGIKMKIFRIDSGAGTMLTRPQDGTVYIGVFAKILSAEKGNP
jgi:hypothetical protein